MLLEADGQLHGVGPRPDLRVVFRLVPVNIHRDLRNQILFLEHAKDVSIGVANRDVFRARRDHHGKDRGERRGFRAGLEVWEPIHPVFGEEAVLPLAHAHVLHETGQEERAYEGILGNDGVVLRIGGPGEEHKRLVPKDVENCGYRRGRLDNDQFEVRAQLPGVLHSKEPDSVAEVSGCVLALETRRRISLVPHRGLALESVVVALRVLDSSDGAVFLNFLKVFGHCRRQYEPEVDPIRCKLRACTMFLVSGRCREG
mmetsp:Transcript_62767/g.149493  ORF Transcript_62767/g.149493 Transcript_62767/m.149493 type:complete len:257 (+) Transcript_62767:395-1165(+)